ncbi:hypothetical protein Y032_0013g1974 [Ancylostoma ceylanicum]|uniref:Uncharacterized protein n=1 Tax=Ancylostoma ceylanicum TaxID=53326 RepID=A0A016VAB3_9BILA|nr:hypothetical protein Y032_0013g1974 [Ancylostoma ceylanicum]
MDSFSRVQVFGEAPTTSIMDIGFDSVGVRPSLFHFSAHACKLQFRLPEDEFIVHFTFQSKLALFRSL